MTQVQVAVAVHRWFERGEGWAHNSLCAARCGPDVAGSLNLLFDRQLKHPEPGPFQVQSPNGLWLGWVEPDRAPLDPRVEPDETPILRAALLPRPLDSLAQETVLCDLCLLSPRCPGEDASLT